MSEGKVIQPMPKEGFSVSYICRYESELDRQIILDSMGHYIEDVLGSRDIVFVKVPMAAVNKIFKLDALLPGEEIEFTIDHKNNNIIRYGELEGDELPPLWAVLKYVGLDEEGKEPIDTDGPLQLITTIEPCKFILRTKDLPIFEEVMATVEIAPKEYDYEALDAVHWNEITTNLRRDIEFFVKGKRFFDSRGLPYNRAYLLHGPPGNGKTTTIKAIAKFLNAKPEDFDFSAQMTSPDQTFKSWVLGESERIAREEESVELDYDFDDTQQTIPIRLLVLEDIDRIFPKSGEKHTAVTLQTVLQALDGAVERRNMIIVATANHPKELDQQVLARPGRFDKQVFYEAPNTEHAFAYLQMLFDDEDVSEEMLKKACEALKGHSYAQHKELFATSASYAVERMATTVNDEDVENGIKDIMKHVDVVMKSEKPSLGFSG